MKVLGIVSALFFVSCASAPKPAHVVPAEDAKGKQEVVKPEVKPASKSGDSSVGRQFEELELSCASGKDKRILTLVPKGEGCELHYQKHGKSTLAGQAVRQANFCELLRARMKNNLEAAGFSCQSK